MKGGETPNGAERRRTEENIERGGAGRAPLVLEEEAAVLLVDGYVRGHCPRALRWERAGRSGGSSGPGPLRREALRRAFRAPTPAPSWGAGAGWGQGPRAVTVRVTALALPPRSLTVSLVCRHPRLARQICAPAKYFEKSAASIQKEPSSIPADTRTRAIQRCEVSGAAGG